jgi:energy-coupling factor transporter ATP-binding protein EcfA2
MSNINLLTVKGVTAISGMHERIQDVKTALEQRLNLDEYTDEIRPVVLNFSVVLRICLLAGLSDKSPRRIDDLNDYGMTVSRTPYATTFFTKSDIGTLFEILLKLRYKDVEADWTQPNLVSRVMGREILRGKDILMKEGGLEEWLTFIPLRAGKSMTDIPELNLLIGEYENGMEARLDMNSCNIANTQILVAGTTGSGKSNLISVLINQIRNASSDTHYPVNFLLFDYKGEFSDPSNESWLQKFDTDRNAILNPIERPLPFTPFKDFSGRPINEVNLYATSLATALSAISPAKISSNMDNRLSEAIINAYKENSLKSITFQNVLEHYIMLLPEKKQDDTDSVISVLSQLVRNKIFADEDKVDLLHDCYIINLGGFEKDGIMAKAIVYFVISKLNTIYEKLPKQAVNDERVELRHFTIIDEAHYMLGFENKPLQNLIAVGRNKGMSIILATQNMESFKSKYFDFYANAQYPLIMKQQQQNDAVLKDLFGVSGGGLQELKQAIAGLQKGELITRDAANMALGIGKSWQKIKVTHLI